MHNKSAAQAVLILFAASLPAYAVPFRVSSTLVFGPSLVGVLGSSPGDFDLDGDVDLNDYLALQNCINASGPGAPASSACLPFDANGDFDIDFSDAADFQNAFTGTVLRVCGNRNLETGEQCDDGNTISGDGCSSTCQVEITGIENDNCANPTSLNEGTQLYSNVGAIRDGPSEPNDCLFFGSSDIESDIWYCYTATCSGPAVISLCGSGYDTKLAAYSGCACPSARPIACSDDDCGTGTDNVHSRVSFNVTTGHAYMVRVGGYLLGQGEGRLTIRCGQDTCEEGTGSCVTAHDANQPGCDDPMCCNRVCEVDTFCCDVTWDDFCASQAGGFCSPTGFPTCNAQAGRCNHPNNTPGCRDTACCNAICQTDPYCCITNWDNNCVTSYELICVNCGSGRGDCYSERLEPGCQDVSCCGIVCAVDEFCCTVEWDIVCAQEATQLCQPN